MSTAMILAAGLGTRLRPLSDLLPKPLVPIGDAPALAHIALALARGDVTRLVMNTYHNADAFDSVRGLVSLPLTVVREPTLLGTAGGVANAREYFEGDDLLVWNGDTIACPNLAALRAALAGAEAALLAAPRPAGEGTLGVDAVGRLVRLRDIVCGRENRGGDFIGVSLLGAALLSELPATGCLVGDVLCPLLARGARVHVIAHEGPWDDIGTPTSYLAANLRWLREHAPAGYAAEGVTIQSGTRCERSIVGAGASVTGKGVLREVVVWPGAVARAPLERAVVTRSSVVRIA